MPAAGDERDVVAPKIAEPMSLEEQLAATILDDLRLDLRGRLTGSVIRGNTGARRANDVDRRNRAGEIIRRQLRFGDDELRLGVARDRHRRRERRVLVGRPHLRAWRRAVLPSVRDRDARIGRAIDRQAAEARVDRRRSCSD